MKDGVSSDNKRVWNIDMDEARDLYLGMYYKVDCISHLIQNCHISYRSFKYWHSHMLHAKALGVVTAYDILEGSLRRNGRWKNP